ncbi:hypothetical protein CFC21_078856 [Triticum aestivum]|uniref:Uncharacterized protein n=2 Tax=Triticum aestivum TaxID=4565 RepID=A0A3B6MX46_WHEAT|nr:uncharacterized protein LOC123125271 [Triticum aestivum]XP_044401725.1 uncharacterized protein LOC123125271 [Triticum aestivum]KAF7073935.1 hypothetical protein CFC21_078856 [Triticum aestivum]
MDGTTPHHLLPPSEAKKEIRDDVPLVCAWALINAFSIVCGAASGYIAAYIHVSCSQSSFILPCIQLTDAAKARLIALFIGMLCCAASQAAAAAPALLLPRRRRWARRALAYLALAVTILFHCMYASLVWILLAADPGHMSGRIYYTVIICFMVVCDLLSCVALLLEVMGRRKQCVA